MLVSRSDPFPFEAVRDLLGILRAMYAAAQAHGAPERHLDAIRRVAVELRRSADLALEHEPGTLGYSAAWHRADMALRQLQDLADCTAPLEPVLASAARRIRPASSRRR